MARARGLSAVAAILIAAAANAAQPFGLISPERAEQLRDLPRSSAIAIIQSADAASARAPHPLPVVHTEGTLPHQGIYDESVASRADLYAMRDLAIAYRITNDKKYLAALQQYLESWVRVYELSFNPIDETHFESFIEAFDLVRADLPVDTRARVETFIRAMAAGTLRAGQPGNNWQSHRVKIATLAAFATGDPALIQRAREMDARQIAFNLCPDGSTFDFEVRDALHYVTYDLEPLAIAALAAREHGEDWVTPRLTAALDWLLPYARGEKTHVEFVHSKIRFDSVRRDAGLKGYSGEWSPDNAGHLYRVASLLDDRYRPVAAALPAREPWFELLFP